MKKLLPTLTIITVFSIAMAFLETAVVIYLRELLYPGGFNFPLAPMPGKLVLTEILREFATIIMLIGAGVLAGKAFSQRFAWFIYSFAIWDIFYYIFLKVLINWPESFLTWDILFLIPTTWTGPVISPIIVSFTMIALALVILNFAANEINSGIVRKEWFLLISGSVIIIIAFTWDYSWYILEHFSFKELWSFRNTDKLHNTAMAYIPINFNWTIFTIGEIILFVTIFSYFRRIKKSLAV